MGMLKNPRVTFSMAANAANISTSSAIRIFDSYEFLVMKFSSTGYENFERFRKRVLYSLNEASTIKG